jgi:outer membrane protein TolC
MMMNERQTDRRPSGGFALLLAALFAFAGVAAAQEIAFQPPRLDGPEVSLAEAVRITIDNDPNILLQRQDVEFLRGTHQEIRGMFDHVLTIRPVYRHTRGELIGGGLRREMQRREVHRIAADVTGRIADRLERQLIEGRGRVFPDCEGNQVVLAGRNICTGDIFDQINQSIFDQFLLALIRNETDPFRRQEYEDIAARLIDPDRNAMIELVALLREFRDRNLVALSDLGIIPEIEVRDQVTLDVEYTMPFRSGVVFSPLLSLEATQDNYDNKPRTPRFGGSGVPNFYQGAIGFRLDMPLGRGSGAISVAAPERAAEAEYYAGLHRFRHEVSVNVLETVLAYINLAATQERLALLDRSLGSRQRIAEISEALVAADELAPIEMAPIRAGVSEISSTAAQSRISISQARLALARAMGVIVDDVSNAPLAAEPLPAPEAIAGTGLSPEALIREALAQRSDLRALDLIEDSSETLWKAARWDLRHRIDLSLTAGYVGMYEDTRHDLATGIFRSNSGWPRSFSNMVGPSVLLTLSIDLPFRNSVALGRYARADAILDRSRIQLTNLERVIGTNAVQLLGEVRTVAAEVERRRASAGYYEETIQAAIEQFRAGEIDLIDLLLTEELMTGALLELLNARQTYAARVAQLRFELGTLVDAREQEGRMFFAGLQPDAITRVRPRSGE